jgi:hypothetical protein
MHGPDELSLFIRGFEALAAPYMVTGATAAILYGQPRVTNDIDVVLELDEPSALRLGTVFPEQDFYLPPLEILRVEQARTLRGHFNIIHHETGYKADIYLTGGDPLHAWALPQRRTFSWTAGISLRVAPPEYVILRKLEYFREGRSSKHLADIRAMLAITPVETSAIDTWALRLGLDILWNEAKSPGNV